MENQLKKANSPSISQGQLAHVDYVTAPGADKVLEDLGYVPELVRTKSTTHIVFMTFVLSATPYGLGTSLYYSLVNGGPTTVIWGFLGVSLIILCVASSLAEITSVYPTAGGVYYQTFMLAPVRWRRLAAWICGWSIVAGMIIITLSVGFGVAQYLIACISIFESEPGVSIWEPESYQVFFLFLAFTLVANALVAFANTKLHILDMFAVIATLIGVVAMCITALVVAANGRRSAEFVFTSFQPMSGWMPGWAFCVGLLQAAYATSATGMITSMCEEASKPAEQVPKAMVWVIIFNTITGLFFMISMMFVLPDLEYLISIPSGQPLPAILKSAIGNDAAAFVLCMPILLIAFAALVGCTTTASRTTWAFARDGGIPGSVWFKQVNKRLDVPLNALLFSMLVQILLGFIYFGSTAAFNAFTSAGVIFLTISYVAPVVVSVMAGRKQMKTAPYSLGRFGYFSNVVAICWSIFAIPVFCMPASLPVTPSTMNYASPVFVGFVVIAAAWYWAWGYTNYRGPPAGLEMDDQHEA